MKKKTLKFCKNIKKSLFNSHQNQPLKGENILYETGVFPYIGYNF